MLPGALRAAREHRLAGQQPDNLCGAYWGAVLLRVFDGLAVDAEAVAERAGSLLPTGDPAAWVPAGVPNRLDYRVQLPPAERPDDAGTSALGLIETVEHLSDGRFTMVPLRAVWDAERVGALVDLCESHSAWEAVPVLNLRTGAFWGSRPAFTDLLAHLAGEDVRPPVADWDVGHFCSLAGVVTGPAREMALLRDSYPSFGWDAHHLQPFESLAQALERGDGREGGVLLFIHADLADEVSETAVERGFEVEIWDNGTPWPAPVASS